MSAIVKVCKKHGELTIDQCYLRIDARQNENPRKTCKQCEAIWSNKQRSMDSYKKYKAEYYIKNKDKLLDQSHKNYQLNKEARNNKVKEWANNNRSKSNNYKKNYKKKSKDNLTDSYVKEKLCQKSSLSAKDIPENLIEAKRLHIILKRKLKDIKNDNKEC